MPDAADDALVLQARIAAFVRAFGLHQPDRTPCGLPVAVSEAHAVAELSARGRLTQHELTRRLRLQKSTVSRLVTQLEARGWLRRHKQPGDGRLVWLELTDAGARVAAEIAAARAQRFTRLLKAMPAERRTDVLTALTLLVEAADDHGHPL